MERKMFEDIMEERDCEREGERKRAEFSSCFIIDYGRDLGEVI